MIQHHMQRIRIVRQRPQVVLIEVLLNAVDRGRTWQSQQQAIGAKDADAVALRRARQQRVYDQILAKSNIGRWVVQARPQRLRDDAEKTSALVLAQRVACVLPEKPRVAALKQW